MRVSLAVFAAALAMISFVVARAATDRSKSAASALDGLSIQVHDHGEAVDVIGLSTDQLQTLAKATLSPEEWTAFFSVRVKPAMGTPATDCPPMLGTVTVEQNVLRFRPRFPLVAGTTYLAAFRPEMSKVLAAAGHVPSAVESELLLPRPPHPIATAVAQVYPSADKLPENLLRFYLHFTAPMSRGDVYRYIHLLDPDGKPVDLPFLELNEELWDRDGDRLTLLLDPGRIKRGVKPREDIGTAIQAGKSYTLVIDRDWLDADGEPLREAYRKRFTVAEPVEAAVDPRDWKVDVPSVGNLTPLRLQFPKPLDHALLERLLRVQRNNGHAIAGQAKAGRAEMSWEFTPTAPWAAGNYFLVIDTRLEDVSGNRVGRPFEVDLSRPRPESVGDTVILPFRVESQSRAADK